MEESNKHKDIDDLLKRVFSANSNSSFYKLGELFEQRLMYLGITKHQASKILNIDPKTLMSFLSGETKKVDFITILKFADFLEMPHEDIINKYFEIITNTYSDDIISAKKRSFIINNFNLGALKKIGFINGINDFDDIEKRINEFFGYDSIFDHSKHKIAARFCSGKRATNKENLNFWYAAAKQSIEKTPNPYEYDRQGLLDYFPQIRWHSMNVETGLVKVMQTLFKLGITLIFVPKFTTDIHVRGATFEYLDKPCIVLTKYTDYYATIWFALIHELYHVLYDWDEIRRGEFHISGETESMKISEDEANRFARQYLFSYEKMEIVQPHINKPRFVEHFAQQNHVHPSIIYNFYCWDMGSSSKAYSKYNKLMKVSNYATLLERFKSEEFLKFKNIKSITVERNVTLLNTT